MTGSLAAVCAVLVVVALVFGRFTRRAQRVYQARSWEAGWVGGVVGGKVCVGGWGGGGGVCGCVCVGGGGPRPTLKAWAAPALTLALRPPLQDALANSNAVAEESFSLVSLIWELFCSVELHLPCSIARQSPQENRLPVRCA